MVILKLFSILHRIRLRFLVHDRGRLPFDHLLPCLSWFVSIFSSRLYTMGRTFVRMTGSLSFGLIFVYMSFVSFPPAIDCTVGTALGSWRRGFRRVSSMMNVRRTANVASPLSLFWMFGRCFRCSMVGYQDRAVGA